MATPSLPTQLVNGSTQYKALANGESLSITGNVAIVPGEAAGKTFVLKTGTIGTNTTTADQEILTYTVTAAKTLYLQQVWMWVHLDASVGTVALHGTMSLETPSGTKVYTTGLLSNGTGTFQPAHLIFQEPIPISAGTVIRVVCTPSSTTARTWYGNFVGYEK